MRCRLDGKRVHVFAMVHHRLKSSYKIINYKIIVYRRCFRCRVCGLQLTLKSFHFDQENDPDVYCGSHVPRLVGTVDSEAMGIKAALNAPKRGDQVSEGLKQRK